MNVYGEPTRRRIGGRVALLGAGVLMTLATGATELVAQESGSAEPPAAKTVPKQLEIHGDVRVDDYYWLRERENPDVVSYLEAENAYTTAVMAHTGPLQDELFGEIKGRIKQTDLSVPYMEDGFYYYTRTEDGKEYPIHARKEGSLESPEQVMLDVNELAEGSAFYSARSLRISENNRVLAFAEDTRGRRIYTIRLRDLETGDYLDDEIHGASGNLAWAEDNRTIFYTKRDPQTLRAYQVWRHSLGTDPANDELVFEEADEEFNVSLSKTRSKRFIVIGSSHTLSDEYRYIDAARPDDGFELFLPRERGHEHSIDHFGDHFYMRTNDGAENFRLVRAPVDATGRESWEEVIAGRDDVLLEDIEVFAGHLVVIERSNGLRQIRVRPWDGEEHYIDFGEDAYLAYVSTNPEMNTPLLRIGYTSMTTPNSIYDYDMETREKTLLKREEILGGFDPAEFATERRYAEARDGTKVPVSIVYRKGIALDGSNPLLLYAYGSYGASMDATFSAARLSLLNRGFVYAIAHIRGGQEMGRSWYEDGKLFNKKNTFTDFIDVAEFLIAEGFTRPDRLFAQGGSAGGLLMGAVTNMRPDLFRGVVAQVPFVDVITTMLDETIPLTTFEFDEWGNPTDRDYYDYMLSYSPYDNVEAKDYPNLLVTTGLHDSQVQYWEPAKWVAKLRTLKTDDNRLLLKTNMEAGHGGASGRYKRYEETAFVYAFLLDLLPAKP